MRPLHLSALLALTAATASADWPTLHGDLHLGHARQVGVELQTTVPDDGWPTLWKHDCGSGFAGPIVRDNRVLLFHRVGDESVVEALDAATGKPLWKTAWPTDYKDDFGFDNGPRSTPTADSTHVYCYAADGTLAALKLTDGTLVWKKDCAAELGSPKGFFGRCCSALVHGNVLLVATGGPEAGITAFDTRTGEIRWKAPTGEASYASPTSFMSLPGTPAVFLTREGITGIEPNTGEIQFKAPFRARSHTSVNAATPLIVQDDQFFTSASYDTGAALWQIARDGKSLKPIWQKKDILDCHYATPVCFNGSLIGFHGRQETGQELRCVRASDGELQWSIPLDAGHLICSRETLIILTEAGELILAPADPLQKPALTQRSQVLRGGHRAPPAMNDGLLYARDKSRLVCIGLRQPAAPKDSKAPKTP